MIDLGEQVDISTDIVAEMNSIFDSIVRRCNVNTSWTHNIIAFIDEMNLDMIINTRALGTEVIRRWN